MATEFNEVFKGKYGVTVQYVGYTDSLTADFSGDLLTLALFKISFKKLVENAL
jgi:hypothetical protein